MKTVSATPASLLTDGSGPEPPDQHRPGSRGPAARRLAWFGGSGRAGDTNYHGQADLARDVIDPGFHLGHMLARVLQSGRPDTR